MNNTSSSERVFGLDLFRAIAILLVVFSHGKFLLNGSVLENFPYLKMIDGVDLFFVLSGFLIGGILLREINGDEKFGIRSLTRFWTRRWLRTLPNYYLILIANYVIVYFGIIHEDISQAGWKFLFFLQNFSSPLYGFFWESWSLSVEEWFYLTTPVLLVIGLKFLSPKRSFILITLLMMILPLIYRISIRDPAIDDFWYDVTFRKLVLTRLDSIAYGLLAAWIFRYYRDVWEKFRDLSLLIGIALIVFIVNYDGQSYSFYKQIIFLSITPVSAMLLIPFAYGIGSWKGFLGRGITFISKISYSMYLVNLALVAEVFRDNFPPLSGTDGIVKYLLYWIIVVAASAILYKFYEKPIMNLRR